MQVWIVIRGECHEGGNVVGVYTTYDKARLVAMEQPTHFDGGWIPAQRTPRPILYWENGCDFVMITAKDVEE